MPDFTLVTDSTKWHSPRYGTPGGTIQYSFWTGYQPGQGFIFTQGFSSQMQAETREAFARWSTFANIDFQEIPDGPNATLGIRLGVAYSIDGSGGTEALTHRNWSGFKNITAAEIEVDPAEGWHLVNGRLYDSFGNSFYHIILHEIGHSLGLAHYDGGPAIMNTVANNIGDLQQSDVNGIQFLYGVRPPAPTNPEHVVVTTPSNYSAPAMAAIPGGGFVMVSDFQGLKAYLFDANGNAQGSAVTIGATGNEHIAQVASLPNGFLAAYYMTSGSTQVLASRAFDAHGVATGPQAILRSHDGAYGFDSFQVARLSDGRLLATFRDLANAGIALEVFDPNGNPTALPTIKQSYATMPDIAGLATGGAVLTWANAIPAGSQNYTIYGQRLGTSGQAFGNSFVISTVTGSTEPQTYVTALPDGGFFAYWTPQTSVTLYDVKGRFYDPYGQPAGGEFFVNSIIAGHQRSASAVALSDGRVVVAWSSDCYEMRARIFDSHGNALGNEFSVNVVNKVGTEDFPTLVDLGGGHVAMAWNDVSGIGATTVYERVLDVGPLGPPVTPVNIGMFAPHDFNGDSKSDIVWRNDAGTVVIWDMNDNNVLSGNSLGAVPNNWHIAGTGDFNGDHKSDLLWRNDNGVTAIWDMNDGVVLRGNSLGPVPVSWHIAGTGDFNGDGMSDLLWRNDSGAVSIWDMNDGTVLRGNSLGPVPLNWHIVGTGDFNGDHKSDILWRNDSGVVSIWDMNDGVVLRGNSLGQVPDNWHIAGTGDFNGDHKTDLLWRNDSGAVSIWDMDDGTVLSGHSLGTVPANWHIADTGDYNGDGKSDILWRNDAGNTTIWDMDDGTLLSSNSLGSVAANWHIIV